MCSRTEPTVQQEEIPQLPPRKLGMFGDVSGLLPNEGRLKTENFFLTSLEPHFGHTVSFSEELILCNRENIVLHFPHKYS